jgi:hypothetical protein
MLKLGSFTMTLVKFKGFFFPPLGTSKKYEGSEEKWQHHEGVKGEALRDKGSYKGES